MWPSLGWTSLWVGSVSSLQPSPPSSHHHDNHIPTGVRRAEPSGETSGHSEKCKTSGHHSHQPGPSPTQQHVQPGNQPLGTAEPHAAQVPGGWDAGWAPSSGALPDPEGRKFRPTPKWLQIVPEGTWQNFLSLFTRTIDLVCGCVITSVWHCPGLRLLHLPWPAEGTCWDCTRGQGAGAGGEGRAARSGGRGSPAQHPLWHLPAKETEPGQL